MAPARRARCARRGEPPRRAALAVAPARSANSPPRPRDGRRVRVLANVASAAEATLGLDAGAEGVGLMRTELAFLDARDWPGEAEHKRRLEPMLGRAAGRTATVRVLDFGGDKSPPFLDGRRRARHRAAAAQPDALAAQLRAILASGRGCDLRILLPMVSRVAELRAVRALLDEAREAVPDAPAAMLGAMVETAGSRGAPRSLAREPTSSRSAPTTSRRRCSGTTASRPAPRRPTTPRCSASIALRAGSLRCGRTARGVRRGGL